MRDLPNRILNFLTSPAKPAGDACRSNPRRMSRARVEVTWVEGKAWRAVSARLLDISKGGAGLLARSAPPVTRFARLRFVEGEGSPWVEAEILGVEQVKPSRHRIRLRFVDPCPSFLLRLAVFEGAKTAEPSNAEDEQVAWEPVG